MVSNKAADVNRVSTSASSPDTWQLVEALEGLAVDENTKSATEQTIATAGDQSPSGIQDKFSDTPATGSDDGDNNLNKDFGNNANVKTGNDRDTPSSTEVTALVPSTAVGKVSPSSTVIVKKETANTEIGSSSPPPHDLYGVNKPSKLCRSCDRPATPKTVGPENENGNVGRHYYACENKVCPSYDEKYEQGWVAWRDNKGVQESNPPCFCGSPSRQDRIGKDEGKRGQGFWSCAEGDCNYHSQDIMGKTVWNGERVAFMPWLV
ncbi:hypothetical protein HII31_00330 [Pseudocercospora fuligena]|uniref:GRF-like zinc ribbon domain-containing protein n=1 Tax=Pseudocercospora fuligena TaxID=685502 RepID=A0A8H6RYL5_9PEZI|nr:hypothetical protein HII31_00330 [Pseudocercospora fuligena]